MQPQSSNEKNRQSAIPYTGVGANLDDAKAEAIRSALSIQIPQYVIADRIVVNSKLERDVTISTMSGYITSFEIIDQYKDANGFVVVTALIDVSEKKVRNYAASRFEVISANQGSDRFDGENIANQIFAAKRKKEAEEARKTQQYTAARKLAERLFAGYPFNVVEVNVTDVDFDPDNPEKIRIGMSYDLNEEWRKSFWRKVELIDQLLTDSGRRSNIAICANSGSMLDGCKRIPPVELSFIDNDPALQHSIVVPVYGSNGRYESCFYRDIYPPIGVLSEEDREGMNLGDIAVGIGAITAEATATVVKLPFQILGTILNPNDWHDFWFEDQEDQGENGNSEDLEWLKPSRIIYILGPNPLSRDFKAGKFSPRLVWWDGSSSRLYSEQKAATEFLPFVMVRGGSGQIFFNASERTPRPFSRPFYGRSSSGEPPTDLCKKGSLLRR